MQITRCDGGCGKERDPFDSELLEWPKVWWFRGSDLSIRQLINPQFNVVRAEDAIFCPQCWDRVVQSMKGPS